MDEKDAQRPQEADSEPDPAIRPHTSRETPTAAPTPESGAPAPFYVPRSIREDPLPNPVVMFATHAHNGAPYRYNEAMCARAWEEDGWYHVELNVGDAFEQEWLQESGYWKDGKNLANKLAWAEPPTIEERGEIMRRNRHNFAPMWRWRHPDGVHVRDSLTRTEVVVLLREMSGTGIDPMGREYTP